MRRSFQIGTPNTHGLFLLLSAVVMALAVVTLCGCGEPTVTGTAPSATTTTSAPAAEATEGGDGSWVDLLNSPDPNDASTDEPVAKDADGNTPDIVVRDFFAALRAGNDRAAYDLVQKSRRPAFETWRARIKASLGTVGEVELGRVRVPNESTALVDTTFESTLPDGSTERHEGEWWEVAKEGGRWRISVTSGM